MKQHISDEQLKELSYEQFIHLAELVGDRYTKETTKRQWERSIKKEHLTMYITMVQKTNIGEMIEILDDKGVEWEEKVFFSYNTFDKFGREKTHIERKNIGEFVDILFEALKEVL